MVRHLVAYVSFVVEKAIRDGGANRWRNKSVRRAGSRNRIILARIISWIPLAWNQITEETDPLVPTIACNRFEGLLIGLTLVFGPNTIKATSVRCL